MKRLKLPHYKAITIKERFELKLDTCLPEPDRVELEAYMELNLEFCLEQEKEIVRLKRYRNNVRKEIKRLHQQREFYQVLWKEAHAVRWGMQRELSMAQRALYKCKGIAEKGDGIWKTSRIRVVNIIKDYIERYNEKQDTDS